MADKVCKTHKKEPVFIYRDCVGCEIESLREDITQFVIFKMELAKKLGLEETATTQEIYTQADKMMGILTHGGFW